MILKHMRYLSIIFIMIGCIGVTGLSKAKKGISFNDDFEKGLGKWDVGVPNRARVVDSGDTKHSGVLSLHPGGPSVYALIKDSHNWTNIKIEGDVLFPADIIHYMGLIYNYNLSGTRADFGCIVIYGSLGKAYRYFVSSPKKIKQPPGQFTGNLILVQPHRDSVAVGLLYPEYNVTLTGDSALNTGEWHHFKAEIVGPACLFYIDDMKTPKLTYNHYEFSSGRVGFKCKFDGAEYWLDNIDVTSIKKLSYKGPVLPAGINHKPGKLITKWDVIGPFDGRVIEIEDGEYQPGKTYLYRNKKYKWQPFKTDARGCVVSGNIAGKFNRKVFTYFHTDIYSQAKKKITLEVSTINSMDIWMNGTLIGLRRARFIAWYDFWENPDHKGYKVEVTLKPGNNHLLIFVKGGIYRGDGFFAYWNIEAKKKEGKKVGK